MLTLYRPFGDLMRDDFLDRFFNEGLTRRAQGEGNTFTPAVDVVETEHGYTVKAEVPGIDPQDMEVEVKEGVLTLKGERRNETEKEENGYRRIERTYGRFQRAFTLPKGTDENAIEAHVDNGVLTVEVPKPERAKPAARKVEVKREGLLDRAKRVMTKAKEAPATAQ